MRDVIDQLVFSRFMNASTDAFGLGKGGTFTNRWAKEFGAVTSVSALTTGTAIGIGSQVWDSVQMVINEYGTGVGVETFANFMTDIDAQREVQQTLGNHIGRMVNWLDYNILSSTKFGIEVIATGSYNGLLGSNRATTFAGELGAGGVALAYDSLKKSLVKPITDTGLYAFISNAETLRNLKSGSVFANYAYWGQLSGLTYQVLGQFNGFVFIETYENLSKGTSLALGANAGGYGFGMLPRTFYYPDFGQDAGRLSVFKTLFYRGQGALMRDRGTAAIIVRSTSSAFSYGGLG
jgi:hypothetical protein